MAIGSRDLWSSIAVEGQDQRWEEAVTVKDLIGFCALWYVVLAWLTEASQAILPDNLLVEKKTASQNGYWGHTER